MMSDEKGLIAGAESKLAKKALDPREDGDSEFIVSLGKVESLTLGGGKTYEDNGAIYQRG